MASLIWKLVPLKVKAISSDRCIWDEWAVSYLSLHRSVLLYLKAIPDMLVFSFQDFQKKARNNTLCHCVLLAMHRFQNLREVLDL